MPKFEITAPDGKVFDVEGPEGATAEQALAQVQATYKPSASPATSIPDQLGRQVGLTARYGIEGLTALPNMVGDAFGLGSSKAVSDLLTRFGLPQPQGGTERVVGDVTRAMAGQGGLMGLGAGMAKAAAPAMAGIGESLAAQPASQILGAAGAAGGGGTAREQGAGPIGQTAAALAGGLVGAALGSQSVGKQSPAQVTEQAQQATRDRILREGRKEGLVVPPSTVAQNMGNTVAESVAGKIATAQTASLKNEKIYDSLARRAVGLEPNAELTDTALGQVRSMAGKAYDAIKNVGQSFRIDDKFRKDVAALGQDFSAAAKEFPEIAKNEPIAELQKALTTQSAASVAELLKDKVKVSPAELKTLLAAQESGTVTRETLTPTAAIELVKKLRFDASKNYKAFDDPAKAALAGAQRSAANALDDLIERNLVEQGKGAMASAYRQARVTIAKAHDVEAALRPDGHINAQVLSRIGQNGYLDGPLKMIAEYAGAFPKASQGSDKIAGANVHNLRAWGATGLGATGFSLGGPVGAAIGATAPFVVPPAIKSVLLSNAYQNNIANPTYTRGILSQILADAQGNPALLYGALGSAPVLSKP